MKVNKTETVNRIFDLLERAKEKFSFKDDLLAGKQNGEWIKYSIHQYIEIVNNISFGLLAHGVKKGDRIATIISNRPEWNFIDMAILQIGAIHLPIYPTISESDYQYILNNAEVSYIFISGHEIFRKIEHLIPEIPSLKEIYSIKPTNDLKLLSDLIEYGRANPNETLLREIKSSIQSNDCATLIYTSGTTGKQKGAMLSHRNLISNFLACSDIPPYGPECKTFSYLPLCHVYERMMNYLFQYMGYSIYYAESIATISDNIKEVQPQIMTSVPRLLEKIYDKIVSTGSKLNGPKKIIFSWALRQALSFELEGANGLLYEIERKIADRLVYRKWREALGGKLGIIVSGGAALQPRLSRFYWAAGISVIEGYGLTETSPVIAVGNFKKNGVKFGTVGPILPGVQVDFAHDGEILCKGPNVMLGYYNDAEHTKKVIDKNGWFHTGDIGQLEPEGQLRITGRKKEIFKTSFGKYISPELIENKFKESPFIDTILVIGENQKFAAALIVPDFDYLRMWCAEKEISFSSLEEMTQMPEIKKRFQKEIARFNKYFGATEQIKRFELMADEWSIETGELTANLKLKRSFICNKYKSLIDKIFDLKTNASVNEES